MKNVIFIKYGGSIITDKSSATSVSRDTIRKLNKQLQYLTSQSAFSFILGNGGGSFGHYFAEKYQLYDGKLNFNTFYGICEGKNGNNYLNGLVIKDLLKRGIPACSVRISMPYILGDCVKSWEEVFLYLESAIIPVLYGDILLISNMQYKIISTEQVFCDLAQYLSKYKRQEYHIKKFILCTSTNGVLDENGENIPIISVDFKDSSIFWHKKKEYDVTGGMREKVEKSLKLASLAPVQIIDGRQKNAIIKAVNDEHIGTIIKA